MTAQEYYQLGQQISKKIVGRTNWKLEDKLEAIRAFSSAILLDLKYADAYAALGTIYYVTNDFILAENNLKKAVELNPSRINRILLSNLLRQQNRIDEANALI